MLGLPLLPLSAGPSELEVMTWNIFRGGDEAMDAKDPVVKAAKQAKVARTIRSANPDIVAMVETYGSGEAISSQLRYRFHPRGTNVSIMSRWPIKKDLSVYKPFNCVGALVEKPDGKQVAVFSVWIHYVDDIWTDPTSRDGRTVEDLLLKDGESRKVEVREILKGISEVTADLRDVPIVLAGDFNSNSHLDYVEAARSQYGEPVPWPVTKLVAEGGYLDSYRILNPKIDGKRDRTWSPRFPDQIQDRIDFIFWKGDALTPKRSQMLDRAKGGWPSDHAAVQTAFDWR